MKPDRVKEHFENVLGRELTSDEWAAAFMATLAATGGKRKRARAMQKAIYKAVAVSQEQDDPKG